MTAVSPSRDLTLCHHDRMRWRLLWGPLAALGLAGCAQPGAGPATGGFEPGYYWQSARGHLSMLWAARPVGDWLADATTPAALRARLQLAQRLRDYAVRELALPDNPSYRRYADLQRNAVVWNVVAAPPLSLRLQTWCFPVLGCVGYRGFFDRDDALALAQQLRAQGLDVTVYGVPAYSTLGRLPGAYFADPLLNTFIDWPEGDLARLLFHELAHQVAYANDDTGFNESFATAVERLGSARWLASGEAGAGAAEVQARFDAQRALFRELVARHRAELQALYRSPAADADKLLGKQAVLQRLRQAHEALKAQHPELGNRYDGWVTEANNASFGVQLAYQGRVAAFERLFEREGHDFARFYAEVKRLAALPKLQRSEALEALVPADRQARVADLPK
ncbi:MAG: aminopeptidase [Burkholderiales bacterium]